jgi:hypothetical protein
MPQRLDPLRAALGKFEAGCLPLHLFGDFKEQPAEGDEGERDRHHKPSPFERASFRRHADGDRRQPKRGNEAGGGAWRGGAGGALLQISNLHVMRLIFPAIDLLNRAT